jgi:hypothetical protein
MDVGPRSGKSLTDLLEDLTGRANAIDTIANNIEEFKSGMARHTATRAEAVRTAADKFGALADVRAARARVRAEGQRAKSGKDTIADDAGEQERLLEALSAMADAEIAHSADVISALVAADESIAPADFQVAGVGYAKTPRYTAAATDPFASVFRVTTGHVTFRLRGPPVWSSSGRTRLNIRAGQDDGSLYDADPSSVHVACVPEGVLQATVVEQTGLGQFTCELVTIDEGSEVMEVEVVVTYAGLFGLNEARHILRSPRRLSFWNETPVKALEKTVYIRDDACAHKMAVNSEGTMMVVASQTGSCIRVYSLPDLTPQPAHAWTNIIRPEDQWGGRISIDVHLTDAGNLVLRWSTARPGAMGRNEFVVCIQQYAPDGIIATTIQIPIAIHDYSRQYIICNEFYVALTAICDVVVYNINTGERVSSWTPSSGRLHDMRIYCVNKLLNTVFIKSPSDGKSAINEHEIIGGAFVELRASPFYDDHARKSRDVAAAVLPNGTLLVVNPNAELYGYLPGNSNPFFKIKTESRYTAFDSRRYQEGIIQITVAGENVYILRPHISDRNGYRIRYPAITILRSAHALWPTPDRQNCEVTFFSAGRK